LLDRLPGRKATTRIRLVMGGMLLAHAAVALAAAQEPAAKPEESPDSVPVLKHRDAVKPEAELPAIEKPENIVLTITQGTPVQVILDEEVRVREVGQPIHGKVVESVYAFDQVVIPVGSAVTGHIKEIAGISSGARTLAILDADFTPERKVELEFNEITLPSGKSIAIHTVVTPGSGQVIQFVTSTSNKTKSGLRSAAAQKTQQAKEEAKHEWDQALKMVNEPGKMHRLTRYAVAKLPVHPQYLEAGSVYFAELQEPLEFGSEPLTRENTSRIGVPAADSLVRVRLLGGLDSKTAKRGDEVEAALSQPLFDEKLLVLPQDTRLKGTVIQARGARMFHRNGELRINFRELVLPSGLEEKIVSNVEGVEAGKDGNVKLDSEGGAKATTSNTRYVTTAISVGLAAISQHGDETHAGVSDPGGSAGARIAGGAGGFKLVGIVLGATVHSRAFGAAMGAYGAAMAIYRNFIARGQEIVFPKNTAMAVGIGSRVGAAGSAGKGGTK
jgi:hypothetical protein